MIYKRFALALLCLLCGSVTFAQDEPEEDYTWPPVIKPCPDVQIKQKYDHITRPEYRHNEWDTVINCYNRDNWDGMIITCTPYIPAEFFNGTYTVEQIPYDPPDSTFCFVYGATINNLNDPNRRRMPIGADDEFAPQYTSIPYPFYFFGIRKHQFRLGANGLVTFCDPQNFGSGNHNAFQVDAAIPWPDGTPNAPSTDGLNRMRDAIYGIFEDTDPNATQSHHTNPNWGIYYGVIDEYPCRKIICSWNDMAQFSCNDSNCTYQIVCYEGSNIIEVHVKQRQVCPSWHGGRGIIGIQNANGLPQQPPTEQEDPDGTAPNSSVISGSPAFFAPTGYNMFNTNLYNTAFRFTPQGVTNYTYKWFRINNEGETFELSIFDDEHPEAQNDTNGWYTPIDETNHNLTKAKLRLPGKYVLTLDFKDAEGNWYHPRDTINIGIDTVNDLHLVKNAEGGDPHVYEVCEGNVAAMSLKMTEGQDTASTRWYVYRELNGERTLFENSRSLLRFGTITTLNEEKILPVTLNTANLPSSGTRNKIDSIYINVSADFSNGCFNNDSILLLLYPNFDTTDVGGICQGEPYTWKPSDTHGHSYEFVYTEAQNPRNTYVGGNSEYPLKSIPGCDSLVRLELAVSDTSHTTDVIDTCDAITWINGIFYDESNYTATDTMPNKYGCDSIVHLAFTLYPVTARIHSSVDYFSFDNLNVELTDISTNGGNRKWIFPDGLEQTTSPAYYSIPVDKDSAIIYLIEYAKYGNCESMDSIILPLNKENFWLPNAFTPDQPQNNLFGSVSMKTLYQEMLIYNRRGELVFRCEGVDCTWDGRDLNGNPCSQGGYVYIIRYTNEFEPNKTKVLKGTVMLLR